MNKVTKAESTNKRKKANSIGLLPKEQGINNGEKYSATNHKDGGDLFKEGEHKNLGRLGMIE